MRFNRPYFVFSFILATILFAIPVGSKGQCDNIDLEKVITTKSQDTPDSTILCLLDRDLTDINTLQLAEFLEERYDESFSNNEYRTALSYVQFQAEIWNEMDSLFKYNRALHRQGLCYYRLGNMFESHRVITQSIEHAKKIDDYYSYAQGHFRLAWIYGRLDRFEEAISAIKVYKEYGPKVFDGNYYLRSYHNAMSSFNWRSEEYELARMYIDSALHIVRDDGDLEDYATYISNKSAYYEGKDSLDLRLEMLRTSYAINQQFQNKMNLSENYLNFGNLFLLQNEYDSSLHYLNIGLKLYKEIENRSRTHEALGLLAEVYDSLGQFKKAIEAKKKFDILDKELYGLTEVGKLFDLEKQLSIQKADEKIIALENERKLKTLQLQSQRANLLAIALALVGVVSLLLFYNYRNKQRRKIEELVKEQQTHREKILLEKKALSAQMNPHFLFNSLNSIKSYIANREPRVATRYLNKFAQLMRITLSYSEQKLIPLKEEIKSLKLYAELEQFRLQETFTSSFDIDKDLSLENIYIPPLVIQPFVENAIWHGLVKKDGAKLLCIRIYQKDDRLMIHIEDNGVGRNATKKSKSRSHKSLGMKITKDRLKLFEGREMYTRNILTINDLVSPEGNAAGTEVVLNLRIKKNLDEET